MRWNFKEIFPPISVDDVFRVDWKFFVGIYRNQHLTNVGLHIHIVGIKIFIGDITKSVIFLRKWNFH